MTRCSDHQEPVLLFKDVFIHFIIEWDRVDGMGERVEDMQQRPRAGIEPVSLWSGLNRYGTHSTRWATGTPLKYYILIFLIWLWNHRCTCRHDRAGGRHELWYFMRHRNRHYRAGERHGETWRKGDWSWSLACCNASILYKWAVLVRCSIQISFSICFLRADIQLRYFMQRKVICATDSVSSKGSSEPITQSVNSNSSICPFVDFPLRKTSSFQPQGFSWFHLSWL